MPTIISIAIILNSPNGEYGTISWKADRVTWIITSSFSIYISTYFYPGIIDILKDSDMPTIISIPIISISPNGEYGTISRKIDRIAWSTTSMFSINIVSYLCPNVIDILKDADMTTKISIAIISSSSNGNDGTISWKADRIAWIISSSFSIDIISYLCPNVIDIFIDTNMTTTISIVII